MLLLVLLSVSSICYAEFETCERDFVKNGCFKRNKELFPDMLAYNRDPFSSVFTGKRIDWKNYNGSLHDLACKCAKAASEKGYEVFAIGFYGECHGGKNKSKFEAWKENGASSNCIGTDYRVCNESRAEECAGGAHAEYVYSFLQVNGGYNEWGNYSECTASCGGGSQSRSRSCTNPAPAHGGKDCKGPVTEEQQCNKHPCPINGGYTPWGPYGSCSKSCGCGSQIRSRSCINPAPKYNGKACSGSSTNSRSCNTHKCPINGGYTAWGLYSSCSKPCGGGLQIRSRSCTNPAPQYNGKACSGSSTDSRSCNTQKCPIKSDLENRIKNLMNLYKSQSHSIFSYTLKNSLSSTYPSYYFTVSVYNPCSGYETHTVRGYSYVSIFRQYNRNVVVTYTKKTSSFPSSSKQTEIKNAVISAITKKARNAKTSTDLAWNKATSYGYRIASIHVVRFGNGLQSALGSYASFQNFICERSCNWLGSCTNHESSLVIVFGSA